MTTLRIPHSALILALLLCAATLPAQNLITNGSFEIPAYPNPGSGDVYSTNTGFSLPGWSWSASNQQFFVEYGAPFGSARYRDGRQAACLNGQGRPVSLSQTFPTTAGQDYVLTFWETDANNVAPSGAQITVTVAGLSRTFSRTNDTGYVLKSWHFTAVSNFTTVQFTDTTPPQLPAGGPNPRSGPPAPSSMPSASTRAASPSPPPTRPSRAALVILRDSPAARPSAGPSSPSPAPAWAARTGSTSN